MLMPGMKIHAGTSGYGYAEWKGKFYPEKIAARDMLRRYAEHLGTVEINNTFYRMPSQGILASWAGQVPDDFIFAIKAPQVITHLKRLKNAEEETEYLFRSLSVLGQRQGPVLFQLPGSFRADRQALEGFLRLLPDNTACAFEFRSRTWFDLGIPELLRDRGCSLCIADTDERPAEDIISTAAWGYLRLRRVDYTDADLWNWLERILSQKWESAFVYFKHEEDARGPELAMRFRELAESGVKGKKGKVKPRGFE
ncbi:MAG TPA: DUF72 domain-containing protein [Thermodesulfovibrionales bacterium]|nr:DUF72 domain-containing protein [Thermodesulfovibrionales bacterium]